MSYNEIAGVIRRLREKKGLTQAELAEEICVTDKAVSKWETGKGLPDIALIEPLAAALGVSVTELMSGETAQNCNRAGNMLKSGFCVCPVCGNVIYTIGSAAVSCCGVSLSMLEAEEADAAHEIRIEAVEDEHFISVCHEMSKAHYISFAAWVTLDRMQMVKFYPEGNAEARMQLRGGGYIYVYCNRHGLMRAKVRRGKIV